MRPPLSTSPGRRPSMTARPPSRPTDADRLKWINRTPEVHLVTQPSAPPQLSPDGLWWWNGAEWVPADQRSAPVVEQPSFYAPPVTPAFPTQPQGYGANPATPPSGTDGLAI